MGPATGRNLASRCGYTRFLRPTMAQGHCECFLLPALQLVPSCGHQCFLLPARGGHNLVGPAELCNTGMQGGPVDALLAEARLQRAMSNSCMWQRRTSRAAANPCAPPCAGCKHDARPATNITPSTICAGLLPQAGNMAPATPRQSSAHATALARVLLRPWIDDSLPAPSIESTATHSRLVRSC